MGQNANQITPLLEENLVALFGDAGGGGDGTPEIR